MGSISSNSEDCHYTVSSGRISLVIPCAQKGTVWGKVIVTVLDVTVEDQHLGLLDVLTRLSEGQHA